MHLRHDALAAAAEWIGTVESTAIITPGLVATVGQIHAEPGAVNVIAGCVTASLDVRHALDDVRQAAVGHILGRAREIGERRGVEVECERRVEQSAVALHAEPVMRAVKAAGFPLHHMVSGAGHDAMIMARRVPSSMLLLRSPGGISHHPDESVLEQDVEAALAVGERFLKS
jgi:allantoate deiminase